LASTTWLLSIMFLIRRWAHKVIFAAPSPSYTENDMEGHLCFLPSLLSSAPRAARRCTGIGPLCGEGEGSGPMEACKEGPAAEVAEAAQQVVPAVWLPSNWSSTVMIYFHANAEDLGSIYPFLQHVHKQFKVSMLAPEYPGYGLSQDQYASEENLYNAALAALRYLVDEAGVAYSQVILVGRSLGSGLAVHLASRFPVGGLILVNAFTSPRAVAEMHVGNAVAETVFGTMFANDRRIGNVSCPALFIHGLEDDVVPPEHSRKLFERCRARKLLVTPEGMRHNSHLFDNPEFLVLPAIHFFHLPGYRTSAPPSLPRDVFRQNARSLAEVRRREKRDAPKQPLAPRNITRSPAAEEDDFHQVRPSQTSTRLGGTITPPSCSASTCPNMDEIDAPVFDEPSLPWSVGAAPLPHRDRRETTQNSDSPFKPALGVADFKPNIKV